MSNKMISPSTHSYNRSATTSRKRVCLQGLLCFVLFILGGAHPTPAHPLAPDLTTVQIKLHYDGKALTCTLKGPANELLPPAKVNMEALKGEDTDPKVLKSLTQQIKAMVVLEADNKVLQPSSATGAEYISTGFTDGGQFALDVTYPTTRTPSTLKVTSRFFRTILSCNGVQYEVRADKEPTVEFKTEGSVSSIGKNVVDFVIMGVEHLFTGPDHILFICTLIFAVQNLKQAVKLLTGFTVGHATTLILTTFNIVTFPAGIADKCVALTIAYVGIENILRKEMSKNRWWLITGFGLIHGLGFSSALRDVGLPQQGLIPCLLGFNVGLEIAQVIIVAVVFLILNRIRWYQEIVDEEKGTLTYRRFTQYCSGATACLGIYWFVLSVIGS